MKAGNTSLSVVTIPNLFYTRNLINVQAFKEMPKNQYFGEKLLCKKLKDLNFSGNPRNDLKKFEQYNKTRYKPMNNISPITYDFKKNDDPEINKQRASIDANLKRLQEKAVIQNPDIYTNDELKRDFANKIVDLLGNINNGDPKVNIVNPIVKDNLNNVIVKKAPLQLTSSYDFNKIKSTATINFHSSHYENTFKLFETTLKSKSKKLRKMLDQDSYENKKRKYENNLLIHYEKRSIRKNNNIFKSQDMTWRTLIKQPANERDKKKTLTPIVITQIEKKDENMEKSERNESKKITPDSNDGSNLNEIMMKERFLDTSKYKSFNYNIFSERYDSEYVEREYKNKVYFE